MLDLILSDEESLEVEAGYWKEKLKGLAPLHLPTDFTRPIVGGNSKTTVELFIDNEINEKLN